MRTADFFRARLVDMIDLRHPLAVLATRMPWQTLEAALALTFARKQATASGRTFALTRLATLVERAERIRTQQPKDKNKLYAMHAPEVECIGKRKARKPSEFGVNASIAVRIGAG